MVKGLNRRVVVVRFPDKRAFEQAIFIMRDENPSGVSANQLVNEACGIAEGYVKKRERRKRLPPLIYIASGAAFTGLVWLITFLVGN